MINTPYQTLSTYEALGSCGEFGIRIEVASSALTNIEALKSAGSDAIRILEDEMLAAIMAASPDAKEQRIKERAEILGCFDAPIYVEEIPNGYCSKGCCRHLPWFLVTTPVGHIKIGWRKHVIEIDWENTFGAKSADELFADEDVTKEDQLIHAWSASDARRYVSAIVSGNKEGP